MTAEQHIFHLVQALQEATDAVRDVAHKYDRRSSSHTEDYFDIPNNELRVEELYGTREFGKYTPEEITEAVRELERKEKILTRLADNGDVLIRVKPL